jgi:hypothetical protein
MKNYKKILVALTLITGTLFLTSCEEAEEDLLKEAQLCLNKATASEALACVTKIESNTTVTAYALRCTAVFVSQNKADADQILEALKKLSGPTTDCTGQCSPIIPTIKAFNFTDRASANYAFDNCIKAGAKTYAQLASIIKFGTIIYERAKLIQNPPNEDDLKFVLTSTVDNTDKSDIGGVIFATYGIVCSDPVDKQSESVKPFCEEVKVAIDAGSTDLAMGACFVKRLDNPSDTCP